MLEREGRVDMLVLNEDREEEMEEEEEEEMEEEEEEKEEEEKEKEMPEEDEEKEEEEACEDVQRSSFYAIPDSVANCTLFIGLGGTAAQIIPMNILMYLDHTDLCNFSLTSTYFRRICQSPELWSGMRVRDCRCLHLIYVAVYVPLFLSSHPCAQSYIERTF